MRKSIRDLPASGSPEAEAFCQSWGIDPNEVTLDEVAKEIILRAFKGDDVARNFLYSLGEEDELTTTGRPRKKTRRKARRVFGSKEEAWAALPASFLLLDFIIP